MMKVIVGVVAAGLLAAGLYLFTRLDQPVWTTDSPEALAEFELGLQERAKVYVADAQSHFKKAAAIDPDFAIARLFAFQLSEDPAERDRLEQEVRRIDIEPLSLREQFLVRYEVARIDDRDTDAEAILAEYVEAYPDDPFALERASAQAWLWGDYERAEELYHRLLDNDPTRIEAQNHLGYLAMAQGRFNEAEERFQTYAFVAPDQANPADSMGELLAILGRYDEARESFQKALAIKPDFCASYQHLVDIAAMDGNFEVIDGLEQQYQNHCQPDVVKQMQCRIRLWRAFWEHDLEAPHREENQPCFDEVGDCAVVAHRLMVMSGHLSDARALEERLRENLKPIPDLMHQRREVQQAVLAHMEGVRLTAQGDLSTAAEDFELADAELEYWSNGQGLLKLCNRLYLAHALKRMGDFEGAEVVLRKVDEVNRSLAEVFALHNPQLVIDLQT